MLRASRYVITAISRLLVDVGEGRHVRRLRCGDRLVDPVVDVLLDRLHVGLGEHVGGQHLLAEQRDRIAQLLALDLVLRAVDRAGRVAHRVAAVAVRVGLEERGRLLLSRPGDRAGHRLADRQHVHAVEALGRDAVGLAELPDLGLRQRALDRGAHGVAVVLAQEDHWQLPEGGEIHGFVKLPLRYRAVAEVADDDLVTALILDGEAHAHRDRQVRADDGVTAEEVDALVEEVHRAAFAAREPIAPAVELGHGALGIRALGQAVAVLAIGGDRVVIRPKRGRRADRDRFLADVEMQESADLAEGIRLRGLLLETADEEHVGQELLGEGRVDARRRPATCGCLGHAFSCYQRMMLKSSTESRRRMRKIATMIARPTATSAAATAITKKTTAWPSRFPARCPKATSARFAAFNMSSIDMKMTSGLRRMTTPTTPIVNRTADSAT